MNININTLLPDYELIDCGRHRKLERFGDIILIRPEISANQNTKLPFTTWKQIAHAEFHSHDKRVNGEWKKYKEIPETWTIDIKTNCNETIKPLLKLSTTKHIGIFPEQSFNFSFIESQKQGNILNLFGYTGVISIFSAQINNFVTHIDSVKKVNQWGKTSMMNSNVNNIRWITEDAQAFVDKEIRRGNKYNGIILDPPAIGKGPKGQTWIIEKSLHNLLQNIVKITTDNCFIIMNLYSNTINKKFLHKIILKHFRGFKVDFCDQLNGASKYGNNINHGYLLRLIRKI